MPEPILAVDLGTFPISAALVLGDQWRRLNVPATGPPLPATGTHDPDLLAGLLAPIGAEARRRAGGRVERLALVPGPEGGTAGAAVWSQAGASAGFPDVELVPDPVAAVLDPASGADYRPGDLVLVGDLGAAAWTTALVRVAGDHTAVLARHALPEVAGQPLEARVRGVVDGCAKLAGEAGIEPAGAVLTGGWILRQAVVDQLLGALPGRIRPAVEPEFARLRGVVRWALDASRRRLPAEPLRWRVEPISWRIPDQDSRVLRWLVAEGTPFAAGTVLAQVRTRNDQVYELVADADGSLLSHQVAAGSRTGPTLVAAVAPAITAAAVYDPPPHRHQWTATGGWMLTPRMLVEWDGAGQYVHTRDLVDGAVAGDLQPDHGDGRPQRAGVFVDPAGRYCLLTWDLEGQFWVWDIASATLRSTFTGPATAGGILVDERRWRLAAEDRAAVSVGRYRRTVVTLWDLDSGRRVGKLVDDDWRRRHPGYAARSSADRFTTGTTSPDRRLRATASDGYLSLYETATDRPVFRTAYPAHSAPRAARATRTAFSADGRFLLATWDTDDRSTVDVWQL